MDGILEFVVDITLKWLTECLDWKKREVYVLLYVLYA